MTNHTLKPVEPYLYPIGYYWIGLNKASAFDPWTWADGTPVDYMNWSPGVPRGGVYLYGNICSLPPTPGMWSDARSSDRCGGIGEKIALATNKAGVIVDELNSTRGIFWRNKTLSVGSLRAGNAEYSLFSSYVDDVNTNALTDEGDFFVLQEYFIKAKQFLFCKSASLIGGSHLVSLGK